MIKRLDVDIWDMHVGTLVAYKERYKEKYCFYFDDSFIKKGIDIAPLRASIYSANVQNGFPVHGESLKSMAGLPSFLSDSLPDTWGSRLFAEWATSKGIRNKDLSPLDRLAYIGRRGMGAIEFRPPFAPDLEEPFKITIGELYDIAKQAMDEAYSFKMKLMPDIMVHDLFKVGTSAGGKRPKAVINVNPLSEEVYSGQVEAPEDGFVPMIIKFDEGNDLPSTRIEYAYHLMAKEIGLWMMPSRLLSDGKIFHFLTERFDRHNNQKLHLQTLAAMNPRSDSYEDLFDVAVNLKLPQEDLNQIFMNMVFNIISGNVDDHNKNFSFIMTPDGGWRVAPAYDLTFSVDTSMPHYMNRHSLTINGKNESITINDLLEIASAYNIKSPESIINKIISTINNFEEFAVASSLPGKWIERINKEIGVRKETL